MTMPAAPTPPVLLPAAVPAQWRVLLQPQIAAMPGDAVVLLADQLAALDTLGADAEVLTAAIVLAVESDLPAPPVQALCDGARAATQVWDLHAAQEAHASAEGLRRLLLALVRDLRVVLLLLSRHLALLRQATAQRSADLQALAQLARDIHAPLANRLGIWQVKWELEDLAFRALQPAMYQMIAATLDEKRGDRERYVEDVRAQLQQALQAHDITADVAGRPKHIYSIWRKMQRKNQPIDGLYDLRALRVLVDNLAQCYAVLGLVHALWAPIPGEFDDYIARPKPNGYRSLHTVVRGPDGLAVEVQIRTREMHAQAELGVAAHWRYKEGGGADAAMDKRIAWMRHLLDASPEAEADELREEVRFELEEDRVHVISPKGEVVDLPAGSTPLDFAYRIHTDLGHRCRGAKVDGRLVPLATRLRSGDRVEIMLAKEPAPRRDWLVTGSGFLGSPRSRAKVRAWFTRLDRGRNLQAGRDLLEKELRRHGLLQADLSSLPARLTLSGLDEVYVQIALGDLGATQVARLLRDAQTSPTATDAVAPPVRKSRSSVPVAGRSPFTVHGVDNLLVQVARCCHPLPGDAVSGYLTKARGVSVHRADCAAYQRLVARSPAKAIAVEWRNDSRGGDVRIVLFTTPRKGIARDASDLATQNDAAVQAVQTLSSTPSQLQIAMRLRVQDAAHLGRVMARLQAMPGVELVRRG